MPEKFAKIRREFDHIDYAWKDHLGSEPFLGIPKIREAVSSSGASPVELVHDLSSHSPEQIAAFARAVSKSFSHARVEAETRTLVQTIPRELFYNHPIEVTNGEVDSRTESLILALRPRAHANLERELQRRAAAKPAVRKPPRTS